MRRLPTARLLRLKRDFAAFAHPHQRPPLAGNDGAPWRTWLMLGGRGAGKTRTGAEFVRALVHGRAPYADTSHGAIALVGETAHDVREVMIEGPSGILRVVAAQRAAAVDRRCASGWNGRTARWLTPSRRRTPSSCAGRSSTPPGATSSPSGLMREATFDMLQFGLRLGARPRALVTTTPRPIALIKRLVADPRTAVTRAGTQANAAHLAPGFLDEVMARYAGTRLGRQEIDGDIIEDRADALWPRGVIEAAAWSRRRRLRRIVVGIDPPGSARPGADACGIVAAGIGRRRRRLCAGGRERCGLSARGLGDEGGRAVPAARGRRHRRRGQSRRRHGAQRAATSGRQRRRCAACAPRAASGCAPNLSPRMYAQGRVKHVGAVCRRWKTRWPTSASTVSSSGRSPDRLDALVWAVTDLAERAARPGPRIRGFDDPRLVPPWWRQFTK